MRMKKLFILTLIFFVYCQPEWNNPLETDSDLKETPVIKEIILIEENNILIKFGRTYSDSVQIILERSEEGIYVPIHPMHINQFSVIDTSFDKETSHQFIYRYRVRKGKYITEYSRTVPFKYLGNFLYPPDQFRQQTIELKGIRFFWRDNSHNEEGYVLEKDDGKGYEIIARLPANSETYFDVMEGLFDPPKYLRYRLYAVRGDIQSQSLEFKTEYSGLGSPTNLHITDSSSWHFTIEWNDNSYIEDGYAVERDKDGSGFKLIKRLPANSTKFTDKLNEKGSFSYRIRAYKKTYYSGYSNLVEITINDILPTEGLVAYYPFNGNANDNSGNNHHGTVYNALLTKDRFEKANCAYFFDHGAYIDIVPTEKLKITGNITISVWINFNGGSWNPRVISFAPDRDGYEILSSGTSSYRSFTFAFGGNSIISNSKLYENTWYFICGVCSANKIKLYINGKLDNEKSISNKRFNFYTTINIGRKAVYAHDYWGGRIDDIRIYNRALSDVEILSLYHEGGWK